MADAKKILFFSERITQLCSTSCIHYTPYFDCCLQVLASDVLCICLRLAGHLPDQ